MISGWGRGLRSFIGDLDPASLDLSKATKLGDVTFRSGSGRVEWITTALETITPKHRDFRHIKIFVPSDLTGFDVGDDIRQYIGETVSKEWLDLDRLLVQFWESRSIRPKVGCGLRGEKDQNTVYCIGCLLPEITERGIIDLI